MNEVPSNGKSPIFQCQKYSCQYQPNCNIHPSRGYFNLSHVIFTKVVHRSFDYISLNFANR